MDDANDMFASRCTHLPASGGWWRNPYIHAEDEVWVVGSRGLATTNITHAYVSLERDHKTVVPEINQGFGASRAAASLESTQEGGQDIRRGSSGAKKKNKVQMP